jgi:hypothetical protein
MSLPAQVAALLETHRRWARWLTRWWLVGFVIAGGLTGAELVWEIARGHNPGVSVVIFVLVAAFFGGNLWRIRDNSRRVHAALDNPANTIWIHGESVKLNGVRRRWVDILLRSRQGRRARLLIHREHANTAIAILRGHMPHAMVGSGKAQRAHYDKLRAAA